MDQIWHKPSELCPEYDEVVIAILDTGDVKPVYYYADEKEDFWLDVNTRFCFTHFPDEISQDHILKWAYPKDLVEMVERN